MIAATFLWGGAVALGVFGFVACADPALLLWLNNPSAQLLLTLFELGLLGIVLVGELEARRRDRSSYD